MSPKIGMPDVPEPTSYALTKGMQITARDVAKAVLNMIRCDDNWVEREIPLPDHHDMPTLRFKAHFNA